MSTSDHTPEAGPSVPRAPTEEGGAFERWRTSLVQMTGMGMTDEQRAAADVAKERQTLERDWNRCEKWKAKLMTNSPMIVFMLKHLELSGCPFTTESIQCHPCPDTTAGGFHPDYGVLMCQNRYFSKKHMEDTLAHELIHAYDHCRFNVDWQNLRHHACSEIRAANLSGDCRWLREIRRGYYSFSKQHQACVKRRAMISVRNNPSCTSPEMAERAVNEVWESCVKDTRPFDEVYR